MLLIGSGGVGTMGAYALEKGGKAKVTAVLRSNYAVVKDQGFTIDSLEHGKVEGWRPTSSKCLPRPPPPSDSGCLVYFKTHRPPLLPSSQ